jgi:hypothetical protein
VNSKSLTRIVMLLPIAAVVVAASAMTAKSAPPASETIAMHELNGSGQNGWATITDLGGKVMVTVSIDGEPASAFEPAHVHFGRCPHIKAIPAYNVGPIVAGRASSEVELSWAEINSGKYVINVHKSSSDMGDYVSCANIGIATTPLVIPTDQTPYERRPRLL